MAYKPAQDAIDRANASIKETQQMVDSMKSPYSNVVPFLIALCVVGLIASLLKLF